MTKINDKFFSEQIDPNLAAKVKAISARHDRFVTDVYGDDGQGPDNITFTWLEAWRDKGNDFWYLDQYTRMPAVMGDTLHKQKVASLGICFFDALHYCSIFQQMEEEKGRVICPANEGNPALVNYKEAARSAGQVIDQDGTAQPCADGRILTDGFFSRDDLAIAATSIAVGPAHVQAASQRSLVNVLLQDIESNQQASEKNFPVVQYGVQKRNLINAFKKAADSGEKVMRTLSYFTESKFDSVFNINQGHAGKTFALILSTASAGLFPVLGYAMRHRDFTPARHFDGLIKAFRRDCDPLPDCAEKTLLLDFATAAHSAFYLERAACHYAICKEKRKSGESIRKGLSDIEKGAKLAGKNDAEMDAMKNQYLRGDIQYNQFAPKLVKIWDPYTGSIDIDRSWDDIYRIAEKELKETQNVSFSSLYEGLKKPDVDGTSALAKQWPRKMPDGPRIRARIFEKIMSLESNLG